MNVEDSGKSVKSRASGWLQGNNTFGHNRTAAHMSSQSSWKHTQDTCVLKLEHILWWKHEEEWRAWNSTASGGFTNNWWLLVEEESVFFNSLVPGKWITHLREFGQHTFPRRVENRRHKVDAYGREVGLGGVGEGVNVIKTQREKFSKSIWMFLKDVIRKEV